jgi:hypothetical protein
MPTSGTHITVVEQLALHSSAFKALLGDPLADPDTPDGTRMRFAKLGAVGPDVLYMLGDFNVPGASALQDLENLLVKVGGTTACMSELSEKVNKWLTGELDKITAGIASELQSTSALVSGVVTNGFMALLVGSGVNVWSVFRSPRQQDLPREKWFWADFLHYVYTGDFTKRLLNNAKRSGDPKLYAYALGYLSHYVTDVVGHPYVNQVVQGPFRMHWQRHHLIENFIDAYVWDRWHVQRPDPGGAAERPLDAATFVPNALGQGAPVLMSRLHDHITVGGTHLPDPVDAVIEGVCQKIEKGLFDIGILEDTRMDAPADPGFDAWLKLLVQTLHDVYTGTPPHLIRHPTILASAPDPRVDGFPREGDVAGAYGVLRLLLKVATEEDLQPPVFPDIVGDVSAVIDKTMQKIANDIGGVPPFPTPSSGGSFSLDSLLQSIADIAQGVGEAVQGIGKALADLVAGLAGLGEVLVADSIKILLWLLNSALFALYRYFRDVLVLNAYSSPFTDELVAHIGGVNTTDLWISRGNLTKNAYPAEENPHARDHLFSPYRPYVPPANSQTVEQPPVALAGPYGPGSRPEAFLEAPQGPDNMFAGTALQTPTNALTRQRERTFTDTPKNFGGAIANSAYAIAGFERLGNDLVLPNFDLDGDRGYAWPGWQVDPDPLHDPLDPTHPANAGGVHVQAVNTID